MPAKIDRLFSTLLYKGKLPTRFNIELAREIAALEKIDDHGQDWSNTHYPGGYSSYSSLCHLHRTSPTFHDLENRLAVHVKKFVKSLQWNLMGRAITMSTCWANRMGFGTHHTMHTHPLSVLSGVYYVTVPAGSSPLKIEDPRMGLLMAAPPRKSSAPAAEQNYLLVKPKPGDFLLFESWLRHEVPPHRSKNPRLSISFNYEWQ